DLRNDGGVVMSSGSWRAAAAMAVCTSCAAASMLRSSANCSVMRVLPSLLTEDIESSEAIVENCFSSGVATAVAIVSALAPGRTAVKVIVGKSTAGRSDTASEKYASAPKNSTPSDSSVVATGRATKMAGRFTESSADHLAPAHDEGAARTATAAFGLKLDWPS